MPLRNPPSHIPQGHPYSHLNFQHLDDVQYFWYEMEAYCLDYAVFHQEYLDTLDSDALEYAESCERMYESAKQDFLQAVNSNS